MMCLYFNWKKHLNKRSIKWSVFDRTCAELNFAIIPIHDSFGVHSCHVMLLREKINDDSVKNEFLLFVATKLNFGDLSKKDVMASYYCIYFS
jgi:hypothetical protein